MDELRASNGRRPESRTPLRYTVLPCALGWLAVGATAKGVRWMALGDSADALEAELRERFPDAVRTEGDDEFEEWAERALRLADAPGSEVPFPLDLQGTPFQRRVWQALQTIPAGETLSYTELAERVGAPGAVRAVASACGRNEIAVAIPCHRVVRSTGELAGYRWGLARKKALLERERTK